MSAGTERNEGVARLRRTTDVRCPKCGAEPGKPCVTPTLVIRRDYPHKRRLEAFRAAAIEEEPRA